MKTRLMLTAALIAVSAGNLFAQGLAVNSDGSDPNANAMLDVVSPSTGAGKGMLVPRITAAQRTTASAALAGGLLDDSGDLRGGAAQGLLVYQTDGTQGFYYNTSSTSTPSWTFVGGGGGGTMAAQDADAVAITGGAIDGTTIGATTQAAGAFSEVGISGGLYVGEASAIYLGTDAADQILSRGKGALPGNLILGDGGASISHTEDNDGYFNTFLGLDAGVANTTGYGNTGAGNGAINKNTTGAFNTAFGGGALYYNSSGVNNTAAGVQSLYRNTTGNENTAIGYNAMGANTTKSGGTAIGAYAAENVVGGTHPYIAIGINALHGGASATASGCTAIGEEALYQITTGESNVAIGRGAAGSCTTGSNNVAVGILALDGNTSGGGNVSVGVSSLYQTETGFNNTAVGNSAGFSNNIEGAQNTFIGAGSDASNVSAIINATAIGYLAIVDASNKVVIGNSSVSTIGGYANWSNYSDIREKEDIEPNDLGLEFIEKLNPVKFKYRNQDVVHDGFIAQDVERVCDELDVEFGGLRRPANPDTGRYMLSYSEFVVPLVNAVKEQQRRIEALNARIAELEAGQ